MGLENTPTAYVLAIGFWQGVEEAVACQKIGGLPVSPALLDLRRQALISLAEAAKDDGVSHKVVRDLVGASVADRAGPRVFSHCSSCKPAFKMTCAQSYSCQHARGDPRVHPGAPQRVEAPERAKTAVHKMIARVGSGTTGLPDCIHAAGDVINGMVICRKCGRMLQQMR